VDGTSGVAERQYVWGLLDGADNLVLRDRPAGNERLYALSDYASVAAVTDAAGTVPKRYGSL